MSLAISWLACPADYAPTWEAMRAYTAARDALTPDQIWLCEHAPVYTLGLAASLDHVLAPGSVPVVHTDRGGQVTYHGPGQVVAYCMIDLRRAGLYVKDYVHLLEAAVIDVLADLGLTDACRRPGAPGVYMPTPEGGLAKIAALGVKIRHGRTYHGLALNVAMDLQAYAGINPCGLTDVRSTDIARCLSALPLRHASQSPPDLRTVGDVLAAAIAQRIAAWPAPLSFSASETHV